MLYLNNEVGIRQPLSALDMPNFIVLVGVEVLLFDELALARALKEANDNK